MNVGKRVQKRRKQLGMSVDDLAFALNKDRSTVYRYESNDIEKLPTTILEPLAKALRTTPAALMGWEDTESVISTDDYVTFPVIGEIAAGYDNIAMESWEGDTIDIPVSHLAGRPATDYFVLCVKGDSMFPTYHENDKVLVLKQTTMDYSGQVGAILYDSEYTTLKKIEYKKGEDWVKLVPINANYPVIKIENEDLETCKVLGIPKLLIREIKD